MSQSALNYKESGGYGLDFKEMDCRGHATIDVLPFLIGRPWDAVALGWVHTLRPSRIRINSWLMNSELWRVEVDVDEQNIIQSIRQEVTVGLPDENWSSYKMSQAVGLK